MNMPRRRAGGLAAAALLAFNSAVFVPAPSAAQGSCGAAVTVAPGDTLARIAARCGTSVAAMLQANPQIGNPNVIHAGATLRMPGAGPVASAPPPPPPPGAPPASGAYGTYTVRPGDTFAAIAAAIGIPLAVLMSANPDLDPRFLRPGWSIRYPGGPFPPRPGGERIAVTGTMTTEGIECPAMRADHGRLYTLTGNVGRFRPGDRMHVRGVRAAVSTCQQGTTINVTEMVAVGGPPTPPGVFLVRGTVTNEGAECPTMRGDDGRLYSLTGNTGRLRPGQRVEVQGQPAQVSFCMQGTTIAVNSIRSV
jgi:LysM repeat protein